jgi:SulP family sulfate permease
LARALPGVRPLLDYDRRWLRADLVAGTTVVAYLIPQVMAYAELAGVPAVVGLWASIWPLAAYAVLGTSRVLSMGPESTTALMTAAAVGAIASRGSERYASFAAALAIVVGVGCLIGWMGRLGFIADLLSRPVLVGYMAGIAVLMVVSQLGKLTGLSVPSGDPLSEVSYLVRHADDIQPRTVVVAAAVLVVMLIGRGLRPLVPWPLVGILGSAAVVAIFNLDRGGLAVVGDVPSGLPGFGLPDVSGDDTLRLMLPAAGIALVAFSDNVLTARAFATRGADRIDSNREFLSLGVSNILNGLFHALPVSSSGSRTAINASLGSRTQLSSLVTLALLLAAMFAFGPVLSTIPLAALGAVVVYAAVRLVDIAEIERIGRFRRSEAAIAIGTAAAVLVLGVLYGIVAAVAASIAALLYRVARPHDAVLGLVPGVAGMHAIDDYPEARQIAGLVVYRYDSPLFFANAEDFTRRALSAVDAATPPAEWFVLNAEASAEVDITGVDALEELRRTLASRGIVFAMARVKQALYAELGAVGLIERIGRDRMFMTLPTATSAYVEWYAAEHGVPPPGAPSPD